MKELLLNSKKIHENITEDGNQWDAEADFFPEKEDLKFQDIEWK